MLRAASFFTGITVWEASQVHEAGLAMTLRQPGEPAAMARTHGATALWA